MKEYAVNDKTLIIHDKGDLDGKGSGALVKFLLSHQYNFNPELIEFKPLRYYENYENVILDIQEFNPVHIFMTDLSFPQEYMDKLNSGEYCKSFTWIDHHEKTYLEMEGVFEGIRDTNFSAIELVWKYFRGDEKIPRVINLLGRYDVFDKSDMNKWKNKILPFQFGMKKQSLSTIFNYENWEDIYSAGIYNRKPNKWFLDIDRILNEGKSLLYYQQVKDKINVHSYSYTREVYAEQLDKKLKALVLNTSDRTSLTYDSKWDSEKWDLMIGYIFDGDKYRCSIWSDKEGIDVSYIAAQFVYNGNKGGGHAGAAGFIVSDINTVFV